MPGGVGPYPRGPGRRRSASAAGRVGQRSDASATTPRKCRPGGPPGPHLVEGAGRWPRASARQELLDSRVFARRCTYRLAVRAAGRDGRRQEREGPQEPPRGVASTLRTRAPSARVCLPEPRHRGGFRYSCTRVLRPPIAPPRQVADSGGIIRKMHRALWAGGLCGLFFASAAPTRQRRKRRATADDGGVSGSSGGGATSGVGPRAARAASRAAAAVAAAARRRASSARGSSTSAPRGGRRGGRRPRSPSGRTPSW